MVASLCKVSVDVHRPDMYGSRGSHAADSPRRMAWSTDTEADQAEPELVVPTIRSKSSASRISIDSLHSNHSPSMPRNKSKTGPRNSKSGKSSRRTNLRNSGNSRNSIVNTQPNIAPWNAPQVAQDPRARPTSLLLSDGTDTARSSPLRRPSTDMRRPSTEPPVARPVRPKTAWEMFEEHIKEIDDSTPYFARNQRNFRSSDVFKQVLTDIDFTPPKMDSASRRSSMDFDLDNFNDNVKVTGDDDGQEPSDYDDFVPGHSSPTQSLVDDVGWEDPPSRSTVGFRTPAPMSILEDIVGEAEAEKTTQEQYVAVRDMTTDPDKTRHALYQRYLSRPDTWANGLKKYLQKAREHAMTAASARGGRTRSISTCSMVNPSDGMRTHSAFGEAPRGRRYSAIKAPRAKSAVVLSKQQY